MPLDSRVVILQTKRVRSRCAHGASLLCKASSSAGACLWGAGDEAAPPLLAHDDVIGEAINWTEEGDIKLKATPLPPLSASAIGSKAAIFSGERHSLAYRMLLWSAIPHIRLVVQ